MDIPTYDNVTFHKFLYVFFGFGAALNLGYVYLSGKTEYLFNGLMLAVLSIGMYRLHMLYSKGRKK